MVIDTVGDDGHSILIEMGSTPDTSMQGIQSDIDQDIVTSSFTLNVPYRYVFTSLLLVF